MALGGRLCVCVGRLPVLPLPPSPSRGIITLRTCGVSGGSVHRPWDAPRRPGLRVGPKSVLGQGRRDGSCTVITGRRLLASGHVVDVEFGGGSTAMCAAGAIFGAIRRTTHLRVTLTLETREQVWQPLSLGEGGEEGHGGWGMEWMTTYWGP